MATNPLFNNFRFTGEQQLYEDLIVEFIKIHGDDMWYIPRAFVNKDEIYGEDDLSEYNSAYLIEIYVRSYDGFQGDGSFVSKFGLEIRDQVTFTISKRRFEEDIGNAESIFRPREGDLLYFPLNRKVFEIKYVDNKPFFYPFGELFTYDLYCENFEYSSERFNTGIPEIDSIKILSTDTIANTGDPDPIDDSIFIQNESDDIIDFSVSDPFSEGGSY